MAPNPTPTAKPSADKKAQTIDPCQCTICPLTSLKHSVTQEKQYFKKEDGTMCGQEENKRTN